MYPEVSCYKGHPLTLGVRVNTYTPTYIHTHTHTHTQTHTEEDNNNNKNTTIITTVVKETDISISSKHIYLKKITTLFNECFSSLLLV